MKQQGEPLERGQIDKTLASAYDKAIAPLMQGGLDHLSARDQFTLLRATHLVAATMASPRPDDLERTIEIVSRLEARQAATDPDVRMAYDAMLLMGRFDDARLYASRHPSAGLPKPPNANDNLPTGGTAPTIWRLGESGNAMQREAVDLDALQILVTAGCHFSIDAAEDIAADADLGPLFARHARWLVLPPGREDFDAVRKWNRRFPETPALMLHSRNEWLLLPDEWVMPTFFIVRDGKILGKTAGWSKQRPETRENLIALLTKHGLLRKARQGR